MAKNLLKEIKDKERAAHRVRREARKLKEAESTGPKYPALRTKEWKKLSVSDEHHLWTDPDLKPEWRQPNGRPVWEHWIGEQPQYYLCFSIYRDLGEERTFVKSVAICYGITQSNAGKMDKGKGLRTSIKKHKEDPDNVANLFTDRWVNHHVYRRWGWKWRSECYDAWRKLKLNRIVLDPVESQNYQLRLLQEIRQRALTGFLGNDPTQWDASTALLFIERAAVMERAIRGEAPPPDTSPKKQFNTEALNTDQLKVFVELLRIMQQPSS